jgi:hypothetical protein
VRNSRMRDHSQRSGIHERQSAIKQASCSNLLSFPFEPFLQLRPGFLVVTGLVAESRLKHLDHRLGLLRFPP